MCVVTCNVLSVGVSVWCLFSVCLSPCLLETYPKILTAAKFWSDGCSPVRVSPFLPFWYWHWQRLKLYDFMPLGHESDLHDLPSLWSVLANTFEAVMGAIFLEDGLSAAGAFFARHCFHDEPVRALCSCLCMGAYTIRSCACMPVCVCAHACFFFFLFSSFFFWLCGWIRLVPA